MRLYFQHPQKHALKHCSWADGEYESLFLSHINIKIWHSKPNGLAKAKPELSSYRVSVAEKHLL